MSEPIRAPKWTHIRGEQVVTPDHYVGWRIIDRDHRCSSRACPNPAVVQRTQRPYRYSCASCLLAVGRWVEDGQVVMWCLAEGRDMTTEKGANSDGC